MMIREAMAERIIYYYSMKPFDDSVAFDGSVGLSSS